MWRFVFPGQGSGATASGAPALWRHLVIVSLVSGDLYAIDRSSQRVVWHVPPHIAPSWSLPVAVISAPEVFGDAVYSGSIDEKLRSYRASDGSQIWESAGGQFDDLLVTDKRIYGAHGSSLFVYDRSSGSQYATLRHPRRAVNQIFATPATAHNGQIFITLSDGAWSFDEP
jgi:outer membrane protein assembly factor BamB